MSDAAGPGQAPGTLMNFTLYGGRADGAMVIYPLLEPDGVYLIRCEREDDPNVADVYAYSFANRTDARGNWVLQYERYIGHQGIEQPKGKEQQP